MGSRNKSSLKAPIDHGSSKTNLGYNYFYDNMKLCNYVLSDDYKLYLAPSYVMGTKAFRNGKIPQFHSNILNDAPIRCAGTIGIEQGIVKVLTNESGHYKPGKSKLKYVIELLKMVRMQHINSIQIRYFEVGKAPVTCTVKEL